MAGLLDFAQSASNAIAGNVSAPVDGIAWLMRKLGLPIPKDPVGGSNWLEDRGLTRQVPQSAASLAGETVGLLAPTAIMANAPKIAQGLLKMADNAAIPRALNPQAGVIGWHGSPHVFDKFKSEAIGTGEGAQAYGHGLYLAESPAVANEYAAKLGKPELVFGGKPITQLNVSQEAKDAAKWIESRAGAMSYGAQGRTARDDFSRLPEKIRKELGNVDLFDGGNLYKTDIPEEAVARFLDWDKPLSQQAPEVRKVLQRLAEDGQDFYPTLKEMMQPFEAGNTTGQAVYHALQREGGNAVNATRELKSAGIPGIRYLDGGSRGAGQGSSNFVAFDPDLIRILERNGQATGNIPWQPGEWRGLLGNN